MRRTWIAALALLVTGACGNLASAATTSGADTPLLGNWRSVEPACETVTWMRFERGRFLSFQSPDGVYPGWSSLDVRYVSSSEEVWIAGTQYGSNQTRVFVIDANHIRPDDAKNCIFERVR